MLTLFLASTLAIRGIDYLHQGIMLHTAYDFSRGLMLFRDTFLQYGALTTIIQMIAIKVAGVTVIAINLQTALTYALIAVGLWYLWRTVLPKELASISVLGWFFTSPYMLEGYLFQPWSSVYSLFFQIWGCFFFIQHIKTKQVRWIIASGIFMSATYWARQSVGLFFALAFMVLTVMLLLFFSNHIKKKDLFQFWLAQVIIHGLFLLWIVSNNAFLDYYKQTWVMSSLFAKTFGGLSPLRWAGSLFPVLNKSLLIDLWIWLILPINTIILFLIIAYQKLKTKQLDQKKLIVLVLCVSGGASWAQYFPVTGVRHVFWAATPMIGLLMYSISIIGSRLKEEKRWAFNILLFTFIMGNSIIIRSVHFAEKIRTPYVTVNYPRVARGLRLSLNEQHKLTTLYKTISHYHNIFPEKNIESFDDPLVHLFILPQNKYFHPMYLDWVGFNPFIYDGYLKKRAHYLEIRRPILLGNVPIENYSVVEIDPQFSLMLHDNDIKKLQENKSQQTPFRN